MVTPTVAPRCHRCGAPLAPKSPSRRAACAGCGADVRVCLNCRFHAPGMHHDCREPAAERVADKERANFCEFFALAPGSTSLRGGEEGAGARAQLEALFRRP
ncbi:MAG: hypothetical protein FJ148_04470 [Deltaproteobacteria bacterium]|nr:hypothetical protein [Deltaproteobacteria bacterium]